MLSKFSPINTFKKNSPICVCVKVRKVFNLKYFNIKADKVHIYLLSNPPPPQLTTFPMDLCDVH